MVSQLRETEEYIWRFENLATASWRGADPHNIILTISCEKQLWQEFGIERYIEK